MALYPGTGGVAGAAEILAQNVGASTIEVGKYFIDKIQFGLGILHRVLVQAWRSAWLAKVGPD